MSYGRECKDEAAAKVSGGDKCPKCGGAMRLITNKDGIRFYGCKSYPSCNGTYDYEDN